MPVIEVKNLTKDYGSGRGVFDVSFSVDQGEVFGFLGPNGAGKSTTIRHLMGFSRPQSGNTLIFDLPTFQNYNKILQRVGYIPGEIALPQGLTGWQFIQMMQQMQGIINDKKLVELLDVFELTDTQLKVETKRMSLGVKRKLAVVTAFMHDPEVLILDEPTSGLDPVMQQRFVKYIHQQKALGKTILLSSHIFSEVETTCDRIAIIKDGAIVSQFSANDLKHSSVKYYHFTFPNAQLAQTFATTCSKFVTFSLQGVQNNTVFASCDDACVNAVIAQACQLGATDFGNKRQTLEQYFMKFYKEDANFGGAL